LEVIKHGEGRLVSDPDPDAARVFFTTKSRKAQNKLMALSEAIAAYVHDGQYLTQIPFFLVDAVCHVPYGSTARRSVEPLTGAIHEIQ
jgi:hypothetical protein